jgi:hypothetical protein
MFYHSSLMRTVIVIAALGFCPNLVSAQFDGGLATDGQVGNGNQSGGIGGDNQTGGGANTGGLNADEAFSEIQRGNTVGATEQTGAGFSDAGADGGGANGGQGGFGGIGGGGIGGGGFGAGLGGLFGSQGFGAQSQNSQPVIRTRLRSAIEDSLTMPRATGQNLNHRLRIVPRRAGLAGVNVSLNGTTAIATGVVATEKQRRMTELLLRLEPGVRSVENLVTVAP